MHPFKDNRKRNHFHILTAMKNNRGFHLPFGPQAPLSVISQCTFSYLLYCVEMQRFDIDSGK